MTSTQSRPVTRSVLHRLGLVVALLVAQPAAAVELLGPGGLDLSLDGEPASVAVADADGDGALDVVVAVRDEGSVPARLQVYTGDGSGGFSAPVETALPGEPRAVAAGDLDGDGAADVAVALSDSEDCPAGAPGLEVLSIGAGGELATLWQHCVGTRPEHLAVADLDGDGRRDLVVANTSGGTAGSLIPCFGDGAGSFNCRAPVAVGSWPYFVVAADLDRDGRTDLAVADRGGGGQVHALLRLEDGTYAPPVSCVLGGSPRSVVVADLDGDDWPDVAVAKRNDDSVQVLSGPGADGFTCPTGAPEDGTNVHVGPLPTDPCQPGCPAHRPLVVVAGDFDDDGATDLSVVKEDENTATVLLSNGSGRFTRLPDVQIGDRPGFVAAGDVDADGVPDLVTSNEGDESLSVLFGDGIGSFASPIQFSVGTLPRAVGVADFDGDGNDDLAVASCAAVGVACDVNAPGSVAVLVSDGFGGISALHEYPVGADPRAVAVVHLDSDPHPDLAIANKFDDSISFLRGDGTGGFSSVTDLELDDFGLPVSIASGDFDGDGDSDLAVGRAADVLAQRKLRILLNESNGTFRQEDCCDGIPNADAVVLALDLDGDGPLDLAVLTSAGAGRVDVFRGRGDGTFVAASSADVGSVPTGIAGGRLDDGDSIDLAVANSADGTVSVLLGSGGGGFAPGAVVPVGGEPASIAAADVNRDGASDLIVTDLGSRSVTLLLGTGDGGFRGGFPGITSGGGPVAVASADVDGDGLPEFAVVNRNSASVSVLTDRLAERSDLNRTNRVDGFDVSEIGRLFGAQAAQARGLAGAGKGLPVSYRRRADVDLDGLIGPDDLALLGREFGGSIRDDSGLRVTLGTAAAPAPTRLDLVQAEPASALLSVVVRVVADPLPTATYADFAVVYPGDLLHFEGAERGGFFAGGAGNGFLAEPDRTVPGRVGVRAQTLLFEPRQGASPDLVSLLFRPVRAGTGRLGFAPYGESSAGLFLTDGSPVISNLTGDLVVTVEQPDLPTPDRHVSVTPTEIDFGSVPVGSTERSVLRLSNRGFTALTVSDVRSSLPAEFGSYFTAPFSIPAFGSVELTVEFRPDRSGVFAAELTVETDDRSVAVPVAGRGSVGP